MFAKLLCHGWPFPVRLTHSIVDDTVDYAIIVFHQHFSIRSRKRETGMRKRISWFAIVRWSSCCGVRKTAQAVRLPDGLGWRGRWSIAKWTSSMGGVGTAPCSPMSWSGMVLWLSLIWQFEQMLFVSVHLYNVQACDRVFCSKEFYCFSSIRQVLEGNTSYSTAGACLHLLFHAQHHHYHDGLIRPHLAALR